MGSIIFIRLLGIAYSSLLVGYIFGLLATLKGEYPISVIWVGIVSNGGASLILLTYGFLGYWQSWGKLARLAMWFSAIATAGITIGLVSTGLFYKSMS
jgi:hypothetical protein